MPQRTTVFVSYSHRDTRWLERLQVHLKPLGRRGDLVLWDDTKLDPGDRWRSTIRAAIDRAAASVLLISADLLASDFVVSEELPFLLHKAERAGAKVIPIIVQPCRLMNHPELASFQALNSPNKPLSKLSDAEVEEVFVRAAEQVERVIRSSRPAVTQQAAATNSKAHNGAVGADIFEELQAATITLSVLLALEKPEGLPVHRTLSELQRALVIGSRRLAYGAVDRLLQAGWIEKRRVSGRTEYYIASEGARQLHRLAAVTDGPLRRAVTPR
jgi:TIR domain